MLKISLDRKPLTPQQCCNIITQHNEDFGVCLDYDRILEYYSYFQIRAGGIRERIVKYTGIPCKGKLKEADFKNWLLSKGVRTGFLTTPGGDIAMSEKSLTAVVQTGMYDEGIETVINLYIERERCLTLINKFWNLIIGYEVHPRETWDGHRMIVVRPKWSPQNTGRIGAKDPNVLGFNRVLKDIETVPKGWEIWTIDSGQIEPKIIQSTYIEDPVLVNCTLANKDAYYGYWQYCVELSDAERRNPNTVINPLIITDDLKSKRQTYKTFGNACMYGAASNSDNDPIKAAYIKYIGGHPKRVALVEDLKARIEAGERVFYTKFGTPIDISAGPSEENYPDKTSKTYFNHLLNQAINNPVQGTAADLMRFSIEEANNLLSKEAEKSFIIKYTHDSGTFAVHESDRAAVLDILKGITSYQVENWLPIYGDPEGPAKPKILERLIH